MQKLLPKKHLNTFLKSLMKSHDVVAPVKEGNTKFKKISDPKEVYLEKITDIPAKTHFIPENETLLEFEKGKVIETKGKIKKTILFGLRLCDLNAIQILDKVMYDKQYLSKRKNTILIGLFCDKPDEYCFCNSMDLEEYYDLFLYPKGKYYIIDVKTKAGKRLVKKLPDNKYEVKIPRPKNTKKLNALEIERNYRNSAWKSDAEKCLNCSACTSVCPTCNCFDLKDEIALDGKTGRRVRKLTSCQLKSFSRVAGGKSFRDSRLARFKQFVYHKIVYYKKQKGRPMCVGCGRCCPTKIDWVKTINFMKKKK